MNTASSEQEPGISHDAFDGNREVLARMRALVNQTTPPGRIDTVDDSLNWASAAALFEIPDANGNDPFALERYMQVRLSFVANGTRWGRYYQVSNPKSTVLDLLNVRYLLSRTPVRGLTQTVEIPGHMVYENAHALPRFFLVGRTERATGMEQALALLRSPAFDARETAVIESDAATNSGMQNPPVRVLRYAPRYVLLETSAAAPAFLVTSETYYPGWRAYLDGRERPLVLTNVAFRGLPVPAGRHWIEMRFDPPVMWRGAAVTTVAFAALLWVAASAIIGRQRPWTS